MQPDEFWRIALTSSVLSAGLTSVVNWLLKSVDYENKYREEVLKRRFDAYKDLGEILSRFKVKYMNTSTGIYCHAYLINGKEYFNEAGSNYLTTVAQHELWTSKKTRAELHVFRDYLYDFQKKHTPYHLEQHDSTYVRFVGERCFDEIQGMLDRIDRAMIADMRDIKDVKKFLKEGPQ